MEKFSGKMSFKPEEVADGKLEKFVKVLIENNCEIRLWTDGFCYVVEYIEDIYVTDGLHFEAVYYNEQVVNEKYIDFEKMEADGN